MKLVYTLIITLNFYAIGFAIDPIDGSPINFTVIEENLLINLNDIFLENEKETFKYGFIEIVDLPKNFLYLKLTKFEVI